MKALGWVKFIYLLIIPWLGYVAMMVTGKGPWGAMVATGWLLCVLYQLFILENNKPGTAVSWKQTLSIFATPLILITGQFFKPDGSAWNFCVEDCLTELVALNIGLLLFFFKEIRRALFVERRSIGPAVPGVLILLGFTGVVLYCLADTWLELNPNRNEFGVIPLGVALVTASWSYFGRFKSGQVIGRNADPGIGLIVGQIFIWLLTMPIVKAIQAG